MWENISAKSLDSLGRLGQNFSNHTGVIFHRSSPKESTG